MPASNLTAQDVIDIRTLRAMDVPLDRIANKFAVSKATVSRAARAVTFSDIIDVARDGNIVTVTKAVARG